MIMLKTNVAGEELRGYYSIYLCPVLANDVKVVVKTVKDERVSSWLTDQLKEGEEIEILSHIRNLYSASEVDNNKQVVFAGQSSITPLTSNL